MPTMEVAKTYMTPYIFGIFIPLLSPHILQPGLGQQKITSWWFQPNWKILVKMGVFPK